MALMNRRLAPEVEIVFLLVAAAIRLSARAWSRKPFSFGGDISGLVPPNVKETARESRSGN